LVPTDALKNFLEKTRNSSIKSWDEVHQFYGESGKLYKEQKVQHAYASLLELLKADRLDGACFKKVLVRTLEIKEWMVKNIYESRAKDYQNKFRNMVYGNENEMEVVTGKLEDNVFINQQKEALKDFRLSIENIIKRFGL